MIHFLQSGWYGSNTTVKILHIISLSVSDKGPSVAPWKPLVMWLHQELSLRAGRSSGVYISQVIITFFTTTGTLIVMIASKSS